MAGNFQGDLTGDILVEFDYNNIVLVDPNKVVDSRGVVSERLVDHENLVMYANLEAQVLPRTKLALGIQPNDNVATSMTIARINFLKPNKENYMTSGYLDEITGENSLIGRGQNQKQEKVKVDSQNRAYFENSVVDQQNVNDNGLLGITSISIKTSSSFIPSVSMQLEDIQGRALFQLGDQSPYSAFFNLPYPQFYLTLKGYYGQAIKYQLNLEKFDARFNTATGNYSISLEFRGFKFNILNEILISHLIATPHMYNKRFSVASNLQGANTSTNSKSLEVQTSGEQKGRINTSSESKLTTVQEYVTERGYEKVVEVYSEYKSKGLLPVDFPELTLMQFVYKMDMFEQNVINSYPKANVEPLTNIKNYQNFLKNYFEEVRGNRPGNWFGDYIDNRIIYLLDGTKIYFFSDSVRENPVVEQSALDNLNQIIDKYTKILNENPTLGLGRKDEIKLNNLGFNSIIYNELNPLTIDTGKTASSFFNVVNPTKEQITSTIELINVILAPAIPTTTNSQKTILPPYFFIFEGQYRFDNTINLINSEASKKLSIIQQAITQELAEFVQDSATGIGFRPTVRNVVGIIMANAEAFIRLLDEVHTNAWNVKNDPTRKLVIQNTNVSCQNTEAVGVTPITTQAAQSNQGIGTAEQPVYPWPQFFVESPDDKKGRFQLTYLGDKSVVELTKAYDYKIWPEVEFVEEYIKGLAQKDNPPSSQPPLESQLTTQITQFNAIEYPPSNQPYLNKQEIKFFYEIWERQYLTSYYSNFIRVNDNQRNQLITLNTSAETQNILLSLGDSNPFLSFKLKYEPLSAAIYPNFLRTISANGTGRLYLEYERDFFTTPYIVDEVQNPFKIFTTTQLGLEPQTNVSNLGLNQIVKNASNTPLIVDTYPFTVPNWVTSGMSLSNRAEGNQVYNTNKTLKVFESRNTISNFTDIFDYKTNRPVTSFCYLDFVQPTLTNVTTGTQSEEIKNFYTTNIQPKDFIPSVGYISNPNAKNLPVLQSTSILNSPYFINAVLSGVTQEKNNRQYPYVQAAYLFLNSLPIATLRERYKTYGQIEELDYIASCFNKFGAIHKVPYVWVLKVGSVWHRYKKFIDEQTDILDGVWSNYNYLYNYDPSTIPSKSRVYEFTAKTGNVEKIVLESSNNTNISMNVGFYPKTISDFAYFYNGKDLFKSYTNEEIQSAYNSGMKLYNFPSSEIKAFESGKSLNLKTWSVIIPSTLKDSYTNVNNCIPVDKPTSVTENYFIIPSFGINVNQTKSQCLINPLATATISNTSENISDNPSVFNGSVRTLWSAPNYGYFDSNILVKPNPDEYLRIIDPLSNDLVPMNLSSVYSKIEEIFGVFDRQTLNIMEAEFLNYCKPVSKVTYKTQSNEIGSSLIELDTSLRNFQLFMRNCMTVTLTDDSESNLFKGAINSQFNNFKNNIKNLMEYDVIIKNGNPSKFSRRTFNSFVSNPSLKNPITFKPYQVGSLPTKGGTTTLLQSQTQYPIEWETLQIEVGFSTIDGLKYSNNGSYITDFFVDNDIEFSNRNILVLSQLIKIYATQKQLNPSLTSSQFKSNLNEFINSQNTLQDELLNQLIGQVKKGIAPIQPPRDQSIQSQLTGTEGKSELYNVFKAVNDKWISGTDYSTKTLFEDILFLDRASRNIGETILLDIFAVKNLINSNALNERMSVYGLISSLLMQNNFTVMPLPAYVNFYNVQPIDGTNTPNTESLTDFGNNLWGTFTTVDYRNATPKMVCFYVGKPSEQLSLPKQISGYGDDGFDLRTPVGNPLIENQDNKTDWALSNKVVGFNVDIGIRNQNVFQNFSVSQDTGKATSESIASLLTMIDQTNTRNVATQNASLFNMYKRRSYYCDVSCLGNALIQPTMYFNLRHVPMFNGPYYITEVTHTITPGDFTTNFKGVRQGIFDMPAIDSFIQKINKNLLTKIESLLVQQTDQNTSVSTTEQGKSASLIQNTGTLIAAAENSCKANLNPQFERYVSTPGISTSISPEEFGNALRRKIPNNAQLQTLIYILSYVRTFSPAGKRGGNFVCFNNNAANITLDKPLPMAVKNFQPLVYSCQEIKTENKTSPYPIAKFESLDKFIDFMSEILVNRVSQVIQGNVIEYYCTEFPSNNISKEYFQKNITTFFNRFEPIFNQALESANVDAKLITDFRVTPSTTTSTSTNNQNTTVPNPPECPQTTLTGITPSFGNTNTIVSLSGTNMEYIRQIEIGGVPPNLWTPINLRTVEFISTNKIKFSIPPIPSITTPTNLIIRVITSGNDDPVVSPETFTFIP